MVKRRPCRFGAWLVVTIIMAGSSGCGESAFVSEDEAVASTAQPLLRTIEEAKLLPSKPQADGAFGLTTAIDGNTAAVGMRTAFSWSGESKGAVYIFERSGGIWTETVELKAPGTNSDEFGKSIALEGDLLVVGAPNNDPPPAAVFTYVRSGGTWIPEAKIIAEDGLGGKNFGSMVALSGNTIVVKDSQYGDFGAAYIFVRDAGIWSQQARITLEEKFVDSVAISNDTVVVANESRSRVFLRTGGGWNQQADFDSGWRVLSWAVDGDTLALGGDGGCRLFSRSGSDWIATGQVWPGQEIQFHYFGAATALEGDRLLVGASDVGPPYNWGGFAYLFRSTNGVWAEEARVTTNELLLGSSFGASVALSGDTLLVGVPNEDATTKSNDGAAYVLVLAPGLDNGTACVKSADCASGFCTDGVCCDALCAGTCIACTSAKKGGGMDGVCSAIAAGTDPDAECIEQPAGTCGTTGFCDGAGACERYSAATACDDGNACTENDTCNEGGCVGKPLHCGPPDACHLPGQCNLSTGDCEYELINLEDPKCSPSASASCGCIAAGGQTEESYWGFAVTVLLTKLRVRRTRRVVSRRIDDVKP